MEKVEDPWGYRETGCTENYGWAVPAEKAIEKIKTFVVNDKVVEIGSGYGLWAKLMQDAGIQIVSPYGIARCRKSKISGSWRIYLYQT